MLHSHDPLQDNLEGRLPDLMRADGFAEASEISDRSTVFGRIVFIRAAVH